MPTRKIPARHDGDGKKKSDPERLCSFPECGRPSYARGLCQTHNHQMRTLGQLRPIRPYRPRTPGTVKFAGFRLSASCARKLRKYAAARGLTPGAAIAEVLEKHVRR